MKQIWIIAVLLCLLCACAAQPMPAATQPPDYVVTPALTPALSPSPTPMLGVPSFIDPEGDTIRTRFLLPEGFTRKEADGYGEYLRELELLADSAPVLLYTGEESPVQSRHAAVLAIDVGERDLQQCADAALRLRCEYLFSIGEYERINYHLTNGDEFPYSKYREGYRLQVNGNKTKMVKTESRDESYEAFRKYLNVLFNYASTRSLYPESTPITLSELSIGDVFLFAGSPGHCVIVMDMCEDEAGRKAMLLAQSSMPAQQIHIIQEPQMFSPWILVDSIAFPFRLGPWDFTEEHVRRMP